MSAGVPFLILTMLLTGCASLAMTAAGVGGGMVVSHELNGRACRTFTAPLPKVRENIITALRRMAIKPGKAKKTIGGEIILAVANERSITIELEALSPNTTRVEAVARTNSGFVDAATALEIINQTQIGFGRSNEKSVAKVDSRNSRTSPSLASVQDRTGK